MKDLLNTSCVSSLNINCNEITQFEEKEMKKLSIFSRLDAFYNKIKN
jgi:repressor of nif and glnA expression